MMKLNYIFLFSCLLLSGCEGVGINETTNPTPTPSTSPTPTPSTSPTPLPPDPPVIDPSLESYVNLMYYTPTITTTDMQLALNLTESIVIEQIKTDFYSDRNCLNLLTSVTINGQTILYSGSYTSNASSNLSLCLSYDNSGNTGCVYEFSQTRSIIISIKEQDAATYNSGCLNNPAKNGERLGEYLTSTVARNCSMNNNCTFSKAYSLNIN